MNALSTYEPGPHSVDALTGQLPRHAELTGLPLEALADRCRDLNGIETRLRLVRGAILLEVAARAGERKSDRVKAVTEFCSEISCPVRVAQQDMRVARIFSDEDADTFKNCSIGVFQVATDHTALPGERYDAPERMERARKWLETASAHGWGPSRLRDQLTEALAGQRQPESEPEPPLPEPPTHSERLTDNVVERPSDPEQLAALLVTGLVDRLKREEPGTWPLIAECVRAHVTERLREVWG